MRGEGEGEGGSEGEWAYETRVSVGLGVNEDVIIFHRVTVFICSSIG